MPEAVAVDSSDIEIADSVIRGFTEFAADLTQEDIGDAALMAAKRCLVDAIGCALAAQDSEAITALQSVARNTTGTRRATLIGTADQTTPEMAAFVNGSAIRFLDYNDDYFGTDESNARGDNGPHPSDNIGAVLATAEAVGASGRSTLLATVLAYEVCGQLVDEVILRGKGWDYTPIHSVASAVVSSRLLDLSRGQTADAIRLAIVPSICLYETRTGSLSNWKGMAGPNACRNGLFAALLAEAGITGPEMAFEGHRGFMKQLGHSFALGPFGGRGRAFRIENTYFKHLPLRYELQLPVQLAIELRKTVNPSDITQMRIYLERKSVSSRAVEPSLWRPDTRETADHSGPYLVAAALLDGVIDESSFETAKFGDPALLDLMDTIELIEDPEYTAAFPWRMSCRFEVDLKNGERQTISGDNPKGHPQNPMTDREIEAKFLSQAQPLLGTGGADELLQTLWTLEEEPTLGRLMDLMIVTPARVSTS